MQKASAMAAARLSPEPQWATEKQIASAFFSTLFFNAACAPLHASNRASNGIFEDANFVAEEGHQGKPYHH